MNRLTRLTPAGFTVVELIIAITVSTIMIGVLFTVTFRFFSNAVQSQQTAEMALESQTLLSQLVEDLRLSAGVGATNQLADSYQPSGGWATSDTNNILLVTTPAIDSNRDILYDPNTGFPYQNELIYFVSNRTMYKRTLKNTAAIGNIAVTNCPEVNASTACPEDRVFSENIDNIAFTFYDSTNTITSDLTQAHSVELTVYLSREVFGKTISLSNTMRVTQRNL